MLKTIPSTGYLVSRTMPVDFASYLLSSSPPASSFELLNCAFSSRDTWTQIRNGYNTPNKDLNDVFDNDDRSNGNGRTLKPIILRCNSNSEEDDICSVSSSGTQSPQPPASPTRRKKKVSFADHNGMALATVKIMTEPSHVPPRLRPEILASITQGASAGVTEQPPLKLNFQQPASDYLTFRDRIEQNCMSLENVILRDYSVLGTVKVKNISFEKDVFLRYTVDSWESHNDVQASFVKGQDSSCRYDTFSFEFDVPPNFDSSKKMEFAVCYVCNGREFWDNNGGHNYQILPQSFKPLEIPKPAPLKAHSEDFSKMKNVSDWTSFACWNNVDTETPYW